MVTIMDGEHRVHLNGDAREIFALAQASRGFFRQTGIAGGGRDVVSGPETDVRSLSFAWREAGKSSDADGRAARQANTMLLHQVRDDHLAMYPDCAKHWPAPYRG